jgi:chlorite dismutase
MTLHSQDLGLGKDELTPADGWHCSHFFYRFDRHLLSAIPHQQRETGKQEFCQILTAASDRVERLQTGVSSGHKSDFTLMMMDPDPIKIQSVHHQLKSSPLGPAIETTWSYVSLSEISEYVQSVDQYRERLRLEGEDQATIDKKAAAYQGRLGKMNYQRLTPKFPDYPVTCFYPMNKWRYPGANWFTLSSSERNKLMSQHARSGIKFAGKVSQLITVGVGLDDWEWGVTLWATNPLHLKQIVYDMRFDEASAKYAEFGPFYTSYIASPEKILDHCRV